MAKIIPDSKPEDARLAFERGPLPVAPEPTPRPTGTDLLERVARLEAAVSELSTRVAELEVKYGTK